MIAGLMLALGLAPSAPAVLYTSTGVESPRLITISEKTLLPLRGKGQDENDGEAQLTVDRSNGRIFAVASGFYAELGPYSLLAKRKRLTPNGASFLGIAAWKGVLYSCTGYEKPALITLNENTLRITGGTPQQEVDGATALAFDDTNGRLFAITGLYVIEFDPKTRKILHKVAALSEGGSVAVTGIAAHNGVIYTCTDYPNLNLVTLDENTLHRTGGTPQSDITGATSLAVDPATGHIFALSPLGVTEFDPATMEILQQKAFPDGGLGLGLAIIPDPVPRR